MEVEGRLPQDCGIEMLDICTIFSNALDNALEYLEGARLEEKWIRIKISGQGNMWLFRFENPVKEDARILPSGATGKGCGTTGEDDAGWHGFGTMNMERTAEKYMGHIKREIKDGVFILEAVLFTTK